MKKQNRKRNLGKQRKFFRRNSVLENLEARNLLTGDMFFIGPGSSDSFNEVDAEIRISETETSSDNIDVRVTNNTMDTAELIPLGFDQGEYAAIDLRGELIQPPTFGAQLNLECNGDGCPEQLDPLGNQIPPVDDGSINLADTVNWQGGSPIVYTGAIGDSVNHGAADADFYEFLDVPEGQILTAHIEMGAGENFSGAAIVIYDAWGDILRTSDAINLFGNDNDSFVTFVTPEAGDYYVAVTAIDEFGAAFEPPEPYRPGLVQINAGEVTPYTLTLGVNASDIDFFAVDMNPGDILGVNAIGAANILSVYRPDQSFQYMSGADRLSPPFASPLPRGGSASAAYVADEAGIHYVAVEGFEFSRYLLEWRLFRPPAELEPEGTRQTLFLDFDGADLNPAIFETEIGLTHLTGMSAFMPNWGIRSERALVDAIIDVVDKDFNRDLSAINPNAGITILNSLDHEDPWGQPNVSRIIIGGSQVQSGIPTIGIAESLDVGNFAQEETGIVLLDILAGPQTDPASANSFDIAPGASKLDLVASYVGGVISHEAGHYFGAYHTDNSNNIVSIMDSGGPDLWQLAGTGPDRVWGTQDDIDPAFVDDEFAFIEGYIGIENIGKMFANILVEGKGIEPGSEETFSGMVYDDQNGNGIQDAGEGGLSNIRVYIDVNNDGQFGIAEPTALSDSNGKFQLPSTTETGEVRLLLGAGQTLTQSFEQTFGVQSVIGDDNGTDFGDAPSSYGITTNQIQAGVRLGSTVDRDDATGEDSEDDGVSLATMVAGSTASVTLTATTNGFAPGLVNGWVDFNGNGRFESSEQILTNERLEGSNTYSVSVPDGANAGETWARFRLGYLRDAAATGAGGIGEVEDYEVTILPTGGGDNPGGGDDETGPTAVNDAAEVVSGSTGVELNVLQNDAAGTLAITIQAVGTSSAGSTITISDDGLRLIYTPADGFVGTDTFTYTAASSVDSSTALVTVIVVADTTDPGGDLVRFRAETTNAAGQPITTTTVGSVFNVNVYVDDLRPDETAEGLFAAYVDVNFDEALASVNGLVTVDSYFDFFVNPSDGVLANLDAADNDLGGSTRESSGTPDERLLLTIPMRADSSGTLEVTMDPSDNLPGREVLLWPASAPDVTSDRIEFQSTSLTITQAAASGSPFTNPLDRHDVNNDGAISPIDVLFSIKALNELGARELNSSVAPVSGLFYDVNNDGFHTPRDVLDLLGRVESENAAIAAAPSAASAAADAAFDVDGDDEEFDLLGTIV